MKSINSPKKCIAFWTAVTCKRLEVTGGGSRERAVNSREHPWVFVKAAGIEVGDRRVDHVGAEVSGGLEPQAMRQIRNEVNL